MNIFAYCQYDATRYTESIMLCKHDWSHAGYDAEELYFEKLNRELINRLKAEKDNPGERTNEERPLAQVIPFPSRRSETQVREKKAA
jgi:hypothetical protein